MSSEHVREARARYHELLLGRHRASTIEMVTQLGDDFALSPTVYDRRTYDEACIASSAVVRALAIACERLCHDEPLRRQVGLARHFDRLIELDRMRGRSSLLARVDAFVGADGIPRVIENNSITPRRRPTLQASYENLPIMREVATRYRLTSVGPGDAGAAAVLRDHERGGRQGPPSVAVIVRANGAASESAWLAYAAEQAGWRVMFVDAATLEYRNGTLRAAEQAIDIVDVDWLDVLGNTIALGPLLDALRDGAVRLPFGVSRGVIADHKNTFEMLSAPEYAHLFDAELVAALQRYVPWTRVLRDRKTIHDGREVDLLAFVAANRERFTIKPSGTEAGAGVILGWECTDAAWQRALKVSRVIPCVVQERVDLGPAATYCYVDSATGAIGQDELTCDLDPFVWGGDEVNGAISRIARSGLHNTAAGARLAPVFVLEESRA